VICVVEVALAGQQQNDGSATIELPDFSLAVNRLTLLLFWKSPGLCEHGCRRRPLDSLMIA
jgi:hypothetical protein